MKKSSPPLNPSTTTVIAQVNPPEVDPYDELPAVIEVPHTNLPGICTMEHSVYANFYENYPPDSSHERNNGSPPSRNPLTPPRIMSPKMEENPSKPAPVTLGEDKINPMPPQLTSTIRPSQSTPEFNNEEHQVCESSRSKTI